MADSRASRNYAALANFMFAVEQACIDFPQLRPYSHEGEPVDKEDPDYARVLAVAANKLGYFNYLVILSERFPQLWPPHWWAKYIEAGLAASPIMRRYVRKYRVA